MSFFRKPARPSATMALVAAGVLALALAACGGSTSQYEPFVPQRVIVFGDDNSVLTPEGRRYGVNGINTTTSAFDCNLEPLWVQSVAGRYGFAFAECNTQAVTPRAFNYATLGATVADVAARVASLGSAGVRNGDLALVMIGANDIFDLYSQFPQRSADSLVAEARLRGEVAAQSVNRLVELGAKVVVSNLPDLGLSPYARAETAADTASGVNRAELITRLVTAFNEQLSVKVLLDGRFVGLVQMDLLTQLTNRFPGRDGISNTSQAVCTVALPDCTTATLVTGAASTAYMWADGKRLASGGQNQLAGGALQRALNNPF